MILSIFILTSICFAVGGNGKVKLSEDIDISVKLKIKQDGSGSITLTNKSKTMQTTHHPFFSRNSLAFIVSDKLGNIVKPIGLAKVDPKFNTINLPVMKSSNFKFKTLSFITGTAQFGYKLKNNETYHIVAIYRPAGIKGPGFCSREQTVKIKE